MCKASGDLRSWQRGATERFWVSKGYDKILLPLVIADGEMQEGQQLGDNMAQNKTRKKGSTGLRSQKECGDREDRVQVM